jgi:uncharacterized protein (DUF983 family)
MTSPSPFIAGLLGRCPRCGKGKLFKGVLNIVQHCPSCQLSLVSQDSGDGPVFFALVIVGFLVVGVAGYVEVKYAPPYWLQAVIYTPITVIASILCMRFFKAWLIAMQFKHNPDNFKS